MERDLMYEQYELKKADMEDEYIFEELSTEDEMFN